MRGPGPPGSSTALRPTSPTKRIPPTVMKYFNRLGIKVGMEIPANRCTANAYGRARFHGARQVGDTLLVARGRGLVRQIGTARRLSSSHFCERNGDRT